MASELTPLPYLRGVVDYLRDRERATWEWYGSAQARSEHASEVRLELLKRTIRLERDGHLPLYEAAQRVSAALGLDVPITFYQALGHDQPNAMLVWLPGEAHLVLQGDVLGSLDDAERDALVAHELGHVRLWQQDEGTFHRALCLLADMARHPAASPSIDRSESLFRRHCEVFADRASLVAIGALEPVVSCLVKVGTGLRKVDAAAYIRQADEILGLERPVPQELTHPETYMRVRALAEWQRGSAQADRDIERMLSGPLDLERPDLLAQVRLEHLTEKLLGRLLAPAWMRSEALLAHARLFFPEADVQPPWSAPVPADALAADLGDAARSIQDYLAYVLVDFIAADPSLGDVALAHLLGVADSLKLRPLFEEKLGRELKVTRKSLAAVRERSADLLSRAANESVAP